MKESVRMSNESVSFQRFCQEISFLWCEWNWALFTSCLIICLPGVFLITANIVGAKKYIDTYVHILIIDVALSQ